YPRMLNATARIVGACRANKRPSASTSPYCAASTSSASPRAVSDILRQHQPLSDLWLDNNIGNQGVVDALSEALQSGEKCWCSIELTRQAPGPFCRLATFPYGLAFFARPVMQKELFLFALVHRRVGVEKVPVLHGYASLGHHL